MDARAVIRILTLALALVLTVPALGQQERPAASTMPCAPLPLTQMWVANRGGEIINIIRVPNTRSGAVLVYRVGGDVFVTPMSSPACVLSMAMGMGEYVAEAGA